MRASDAKAGDRFGYAVSVDGDTAVVGAPGADEGAGAAYVFVRDGNGVWSQARRLTASDAEAGDEFGTSVSVSGDIMVVGAPGADGRAGAAYLFARDEGGAGAWGQVKKLTASDAEEGDEFGWSVSLDGSLLVVGADFEDSGGVDAGAAYLFARDQGGAGAWGQVKKLTASNAEAYDGFGVSVSINDDAVVIGADGEDGIENATPDGGAAYVFARDQGGAGAWGEVTVLRASDAQADDGFGWSVSISGNIIVVGAPGEDGGTGDSMPDAGAAYLFARGTDGAGVWEEAVLLRAPDIQAGDQFGWAVSVDGDAAVVGAPYEDGGPGNPAVNAGAAYVFTRGMGGMDVWRPISVRRAWDIQAGDLFGGSVSVAGNVIAVGASDEDGGEGDPCPDAGAAYVFEFVLYQVYLPLAMREIGDPGGVLCLLKMKD